MRRFFGRWLVVFLVLSVLFLHLGRADEPAPPLDVPSVFDFPRIQAQFVRLQTQVQPLLQAGNFEEGEKVCDQVIALVPHNPSGYYNLACAQARQGKQDQAFQNLSRAIELGFTNLKHLEQDADLQSLHGDERFDKLLARAPEVKPQPDPWNRRVTPDPVKDGKVMVTEDNTGWEGNLGVFRTFFRFPDATVAADASKSPLPMLGDREVAKLLREWHEQGTAAGNRGDFYDNHDGDHSNMAYDQFPQLTRIEFADAAKQRQLHNGLQNRFFYNGITLGNSSTALTGGPFWRSQPRLAYTDPRTAALLYMQYVNSHLYVYPEHRDHDPGHNGDGGYGDVYPANTPYLIISQGSSGSDRVFLNAVACTLAAFRPEVKQKLAQNATLMPTLQMILRSCYDTAGEPGDYRTGRAHPTVFDGTKLDALKMVEMAHGIALDETPPMVQLSVVEEDEPIVGRDYFAPAPRHKLFTTPSAIARVHRTTNHSYRMVVSAEGSRDLNGRQLTWHWRVLRGDVEAITIRSLNDDGSIAEIVVPYHARRAVEPGSPLDSNRVDIGVFVHNGKHYSAPGFVTFFTLASEQRSYNEKKQIQSVQYTDHSAGGDYSDPLVAVSKTWRDEYRYDEAGELVGWTRHRGDSTEDFTPGGALVTTQDDQGRVLTTRTVKYVPQPRQNKPPILEQVAADE